MKKQSNLKRILNYAEGKRGYIYVSGVLCAISALIGLAPYFFIWKIIKAVFMRSQPEGAISYGWDAMLCAAISVGLYILALALSYKAGISVATNIQKSMTLHLARIPIGKIKELGSGRLRKKITQSTETIENYVSYQMPDKVVTITTPFGLIFLLLFFNLKFGILSIIPMIIGIVILVTLMGRGLNKVMKSYQNSVEQMSNDAVEYIRAIPVVKTFGQSIFSFRKFKSSIDNYEKWVLAYMKKTVAPMVLYTVAIYSIFVFLSLGAVWMFGGATDMQLLSDFVLYIVYTPAIALMMNRFMYQSKTAIYVRDAFERIDTVLDIEEMPECNDEKKLSNTDICIENVRFVYDSSRDVINDISMEIKSGSKVAFIGNSGSGKTTMANLIARFYDVKSGSIKIGQTDIRNISERQRNELISCVFQDGTLLKTSIFENIRLGKKEASNEEVIQALKAAQCMDIIEKLSKGMESVIGEEDVYLSGGEIQRLSIARILLKDSPILIMDEATAYADPDNEKKIQDAIENLQKEKTVILIAHRLSTIRGVDCIYVFDDGRIIENGSFEELINKKGSFYRMWEDYKKSADWSIKESRCIQ